MRARDGAEYCRAFRAAGRVCGAVWTPAGRGAESLSIRAVAFLLNRQFTECSNRHGHTSNVVLERDCRLLNTLSAALVAGFLRKCCTPREACVEVGVFISIYLYYLSVELHTNHCRDHVWSVWTFGQTTHTSTHMAWGRLSD